MSERSASEPWVQLDEALEPYSLATAKSFHLPGTPLSSCSPRSRNSMPEPTTRSIDRPRCEHFAVARERVDARGDVQGDAADVLGTQLDLTGVETGSDLDPEWA